MPSRWKRVDLLGLSSVTSSAAAGKSRVTGASRLGRSDVADPLGLRGAAREPARRFDGSTGDRPTVCVTDAAARFRSAASSGCASTSAAPPPPVSSSSAPVTRVSLSRLLSTASFTWQDALMCFVEVAEGHDGGSSKSREVPCCGNDAAVPLEATVALYGRLRRRAAEAVEPAREKRGRDTSETDTAWCAPPETQTSAWRDRQRVRNTAKSLAEDGYGGDARHDRCTQSSFPVAAAPAPADVLALHFLAYAAQRHAELRPIRQILEAELPSWTVLSTPLPRKQPVKPQTCNAALSKEKVRRLLTLLSVSTVLHVGLHGVLTNPAPGAPPSSQQCWSAVRTLRHLQHYGGAKDYFDSLCGGGADVAACSSHDTRGGEGGRGGGTVAYAHGTVSTFTGADEEANNCGAPRERKEERHGSNSELSTMLKSLSAVELGAEGVSERAATEADKTSSAWQEAHRVVEAAARLQPNFSLLFAALQEIWAEQNARRLFSAASPTDVVMMQSATCGPADSLAQTARVEKPLNSTASFRIKLRANTAGRKTTTDVSTSGDNGLLSATTKKVAPHDDDDDADAALSMVRALAPAPGSSTPDAVDDGVSASPAELTAWTLDVVCFAWRATCITNNSTMLRDLGDKADDVRDTSGHSHRPHGSTARNGGLLVLVQTATRFVAYAELRKWLERLLDVSSPPPLLGNADVNSCRTQQNTQALTWEQRDVLVCLLRRAVLRAPSWEAVCAVVRDVWPRIASSFNTSPTYNTAPQKTTEAVRGAGMFVAAPALMDAFLSSPHAPARHAQSRDDLDFWCRVVCTPACCSHACNKTGSSAFSPVAMLPCCSVMEPSQAPTAGSDATRQCWEAWSQLLYGPCPIDRDGDLHTVERRHGAITAAAAQLARQWLKPAAAFRDALEILAACHAQCAEQWAVLLSNAAPSPVELPEKSNRDTAAAGVETSPRRAAAVSSLAQQHRTLDAIFLSAVEKRGWLDAVLCRASRGVARQLALMAVVTARQGWSSAPRAVSSTRSSVRATSRDSQINCLEVPPSFVSDVICVFQRWSNLFVSTLATASEDIARLPSSVSTPDSRQCCVDGGHIEEVGPLFDDVVASLTTHPAHLLPPVSLFSAPVAPAIASLLCAVRHAITEVGLRLEHELNLRARQSQRSNTPSRESTADLLAAATDARLVQVVGTSGAPASSQHADSVVLDHMHGWLNFLCGCPTMLLDDEHYAVVWLYILMRQVEELHVRSIEDDMQPQSCASQLDITWQQSRSENADGESSGGGVHDSTQIPGNAAFHARKQKWSATAEAAVVRRAAQSLSAKLWSLLPSSSLLPPMLLNWLLTRGGARTWGDAVRVLRTAAGAPDETRRDGRSAHSTMKGSLRGSDDEDGRRRYALLGLPLDQVVSMAHAMRVLRTLQLVEERYARAMSALASGEDSAATDSSRAPRERSAFWADAQPLNRFSTTRAKRGMTFSTTASKCRLETAGQLEERCPPQRSGTSALRLTAKADGGPKDDVAADVVVRYYYQQIERVVLREWYRRALAAVLRYLRDHPEHTYLTHVGDAPGHAALVLRERLAAELARSAVLHDTPADSSATMLKRWRSWDGPASRAEESEEGRGATGRTTCSAERRIPAHVEAAVDDAASVVPHNTPRASMDVPPSQRVCVPLHFLGSFVLQEARIGAPLADATRETSVHQAAKAALAQVAGAWVNSADEDWQPLFDGEAETTMNRTARERRSRPHASLSLSALFAETDRLLFANVKKGSSRLREPLQAKSQLSDGVRARPVHPELLHLFESALQAQKTVRDGEGGHSSGETVEDVVLHLLELQCDEAR